MNDREKLVLLLDDTAHEGIVQPLQAGGRRYLHKKLSSGSSNWRKIIAAIDTHDVTLVLSKLTTPLIQALVHAKYRDVRDELFQRIISRPHAVFIFEGLLNGQAIASAEEWDVDDRHRYDDDYYVRVWKHDIPTLTAGLEYLDGLPLNILPYRTRAQVTVAAHTLVDDTEKGLLFRMYVPYGRLWQEEIDRLLTLFRDYLAKIGQVSVRLDQSRTDHGVIYAFHGEPNNESRDLASQFADFSRLVDLSVSDPAAAAELLKTTTIDPRENARIVERYSKEARRLQLDMRHDRETKALSIRHRLETELAETFETTVDSDTLTRIIDAIVPRGESVLAAESIDRAPLLLSGAVTINVNPQIISHVEGVVAQEIRGDFNLAQEDRQLLQLFERYGGSAAPELTSALHELSDTSAPAPRRLTGGQKIKAFLYKVGNLAGEIGTGVLQAYIEKKLLGT